MKKSVWDIYIGPGKKEAFCPLCGVHRIYATQNSGYEFAHIVPACHMEKNEMSVFYAFPSCKSCNNECSDDNLFDFLFVRGRIQRLTYVIRKIYEYFLELHENELDFDSRRIWVILESMYGKQKFPFQGHIINTGPIYELARTIQVTLLNEKIQAACQNMDQLTKELANVTKEPIKSIHLTQPLQNNRIT